MNSTNRLIVAILVVAALAIGFWVLLLGPKREKVDELSQQVDNLNASLVQAENSVAIAEEAKRAFPDDYRQLVTLGTAVPAGDETSSLLVELNAIADDSKVDFEGIQLGAEGSAAVATTPAPEAPVEEAPPTESSGAVPASATIPPTEAAASVLPLGATIGPAGLAVMPYSLTFRGSFFEIADFISGVDALVDPKELKVGVDGRLVTIDGFALTPNADGSEILDVNFLVTTYVTPPGEGVTAGATPGEPAPVSEGTEVSPEAETVAAQ